MGVGMLIVMPRSLLALTDQLLDAALGELGVVAREQPCLVVACLAKGISAGFWVDLEGCLGFCFWSTVFKCVVQEDRWILPHLAVRTHFEFSRWVSRVSQPVQRTPLWASLLVACA